MAQTLFDIGNPQRETKKELVITNQVNSKLSKQQQAFNRLVKKIESLRAQMKETATQLDSHLEYHSKHLYPLEQQEVKLRKDVLKLLFPFYKDKKQLSQNQRKSLLDLMRDLLQSILDTDMERPDAEIQEIFEAIEGIDYEEAYDRDFESMKEEMEMMFRDQGVNVDLNDMHKDMGPEEMARKMKEINDQINREQENRGTKKEGRKKTKRQAEKIEKERLMEEARSKNIGNIYKQLVKVLHPDLEKDDTKRPMKEELMKQLSIAYKNNDLHGLLKLELEWINMEGSNTQKLTDDKLNIYNEVLKEQVQDLEFQINMIAQHPRYEALSRYYNPFLGFRGLNLAEEKRNREALIQTLIVSLNNLKGANPLREIKELIRIHKSQKVDFDFLEFI